LFLLAFLHGAEAARASNWRPITPQDLNLTAGDTGDPEADAAVLFREGELNDNTAEGTSLKLYIRIKIFNERGRRFVDVQLPYRADLCRLTEVRARTIRPDGFPIDVDSKDVFDKLLLKTGHGVWRAKAFSMPAVEVGSIIEYRFRQTYPQGFRYFALDLQSDLFIKELFYKIQPQSASRFDVRWVTFNTPDPKRFAPTWDGTYNIRAHNIPPFRRELLMPPEPTVKVWGWLYYSDEPETNPDKYWKKYAQRMHERASNETKPSGAIARVVDSITLKNDGPREKINRIYEYVQSEIENIGLRDEQGPEDQPISTLERNRSADQTIRRRYGTPREINRLFISMLRAAGLDARVAELTTRDEDFFRKSFPDSFQLNSEVTAVIARDGSIQFYDPGTRFCPVGILSWEKQAVQALVYGRHDGRFVETTVRESTQNSEERKFLAFPQTDGRVDVHADVKVVGQPGIELRNQLVDLSADEMRKQVVAQVRKAAPTALVDDASIALSNLNNGSLPLQTVYKFSVPQFVARTDSRLLMRPAALGHSEESLLASTHRSNSVYFKYPRNENEQVIIRIPTGYEVEQLPEPVIEDIGAAKFRAEFVKDGENVVYRRNLIVDGIVFTVEQYPIIKGFFDRVNQADKARIVFKQIDGPSR
jgi:transglutaminase-like putative cysteine protease